MNSKIRTAKASDGPALAAIYAPYTETVLTFEYPAPTAEEFARRVETVTAEYPFLVCEQEGRPVGYAYAHRYRERAAYDWDAELSVYLEAGSTGKGIGRALYRALLDILYMQGYINIYGTVSVPNPASEGLHESLGFRRVYTDEKTGWKFGRWLDLAFYRLQLRPYADEPERVTRFPELDEAKVAKACMERAKEIGETRR